MNIRLLAFRKLYAIIKDTPTIDATNVSLLFSTLVYFSNEFIEKIAAELGAEFLHIQETNGLKFLYVGYKAQHFIAFRGTEFSMWSNTKRVLNFIPKKGLLGRKAHRGFIMAFADLKRKIDPLIFRPKSVIFTGHSLGGALAILGAEYYGGSAVTFASPKVYFNEHIKSSISAIGYNVTKDPVTLIPPTTFFMKWSRPVPQILWKTTERFVNFFSYHRVSTYINHTLELLNERGKDT